VFAITEINTVPHVLGRAHRPAPKRPNFIPSTPNYFAYSFLDKDPDMDLIVGLIGEAGLSPEDIEHETAKLGHRVSRHTIIGWLYGSTRRPQGVTMTLVAMACGWVKTWHPVNAVATKPRATTRATKPQSERVNVH
jgi:hypothetical protein